jgi:hypothetical protein
MQPSSEDPESGPESDPQPETLEESHASSPDYRRLLFALLAYAVLGVLAALRLDGNPRLVVWLFLGLFAVKSLLVVLKQSAN